MWELACRIRQIVQPVGGLGGDSSDRQVLSQISKCPKIDLFSKQLSNFGAAVEKHHLCPGMFLQ